MTNNKQQTAVEWFANQLHRVVSNTTDALTYNHKELLEQAKEMEKEQIMDARRNGSYKATEKYGETRTNIQYYNETYGEL
jgi:hypothetical protein